LDPSDPHVRESEAFPSLTADQVERVSSFGVVQRLQRGTTLYEPGDRTADFFLVLDGFIEIYVSRNTTQRVVHEYGEQQFTGELNLFNDRATLVGGRMGCSCSGPPNTEWLDCVALDEKGFVRTGMAAASDDPMNSHALSQPLATSCPGVFAVGDVRSGSIKRVASAVGEGSIVVAAVHQLLGTS
jgi:CRP-like cAMP-binding protein